LVLFQAAVLLYLLEASGAGELRLAPSAIELGALYQDVPVRIEGLAPPEARIIVTLRGADAREEFNKKGRVGPVWLNVGKVRISGAPSLFLCFSEAPVETLLVREEIERYQLDEAAIRRRMRIEPAELDQPELREHYWNLRAEQGSYAIHSGAVQSEPAGEQGRRYRVEFLWPRKAPPGSYTVTAYQCRQGRVVAQSSAALTVRRVGLPATIAALAQQHAAQYAVLAVIAAMLAGFGIDFIVTRLGGKRRRLKAAGGARETESERQPTGSLRRGGH